MKKIYICLAGMLASGFVMSQKIIDVPVAAKNSEGFIQKVKPGNLIKPKGATLWSDDMSDSTRWMVTNAPNGTPAHTCCDWAWSDDIDASPRPEFVPFGHTSVANGYMMIISGATGEILSYAPTPDGKETYMSPIVYQPHPEMKMEVLFGTMKIIKKWKHTN